MSLRRAPAVPAISSRLDAVLRIGHEANSLKATTAPTAPTAPTAVLPPNNTGPNQQPQMKITDLDNDVLDQILARYDLSCVEVIKYLQATGQTFLAELEGFWKALCERNHWRTNPFSQDPSPYKGTWRMHFNEWCRWTTMLQKGKTSLNKSPDSYKKNYEVVVAAALAQPNLSCKTVIEYLQATSQPSLAELEEFWKALCRRKRWTENIFDDTDSAPYMGKWQLHFDKWCEAIMEVRKDGWGTFSILKASHREKSSSAFMLAVVRRNGVSLSFASDEVKNDREVVLAALWQRGDALAYASDELKNDREIVLTALKRDGIVLRHASPELQRDHEIIREALKSAWQAIELVPPTAWDDYEFALELLRMHVWFLEYAPMAIKADPRIVLAAVKKNGNMLRYASDELRDDRIIVLAAVKKDGDALRFASPRLKDDPEVRAAAGL